MYQNITVVALFAFVYSLLAGRLDKAVVNGPVIYLLFGVIAGPLALGLVDLSVGEEGLQLVAELTLALVLYTDASNADLGVLKRTMALPRRLLLLGLPLTILLGIGAGMLLFPELGFLQIALLATMLAPTDAALGKAVVSNQAVPPTVRQALNVESGLNDGICVPIILTFLALATQADGSGSPGELAVKLVVEAIGIGVAVGVALAFAGARLLRAAARERWVSGEWIDIPIVALAFASFALAQGLGGSGFIACFVGGITFGALASERKHEVLEGAEGVGNLFALITWVIFGAAVVLQHPGLTDWRVILYAVLSLTVVRMLPVFLSSFGMNLRVDAKLFLGWFGPRGLASIVFLVIAMQANLPGIDTIMGTVVATVVLSILGHGLTANPLAARFGAREKADGAGAS